MVSEDTNTGSGSGLREQPAAQAGKNIVICLDGTGNQFGENLSNVVKLFRMLNRSPSTQIAYYDPGVGTMGDPAYKTRTARKINKVLGLAFGRGLTKNLIEAFTYLMEHYDDGDRIYIFGFSRGAYTARALAGFIKDFGLFDRGAENLLPYAMGLYLKQAPEDDKDNKFYKIISGFRSTYGRKFRKDEDPKYPNRTVSAGESPYHYQLRIHFLGLFDTVKSYGWVKNPVVLRNEQGNPSILHLRHALAIDERRNFFRQMHWSSSKNQDCKEVWFPGVHSDVGGGYAESESGLAKVALEWMVHEACALGMTVDPYRYGRTLAKIRKPGDDENAYPRPDAKAEAHESLKGPWKAVQLLPKANESWELARPKDRRTIKSEADRMPNNTYANPLLLHESVLERANARADYPPENLLLALGEGGIASLPDANIERTRPDDEVFGAAG